VRNILYDKLDPNIKDLVRALNDFQGIHTLGSCGGHPDPKPGQWQEGTYYVIFEVEHNEAGWFALEFLAWLINHDYRRAGHAVTIYPDSLPPYLNEPGRCLHFALEGYEDEDPNELTKIINEAREQHYIPPRVLKED
jgi:hypothetical protein